MLRVDLLVPQATFFPLDADEIENAAPQPFSLARGGGFQLTLEKSQQLAKPVSVLRGLIVFPARAYEIAAPVRP